MNRRDVLTGLTGISFISAAMPGWSLPAVASTRSLSGNDARFASMGLAFPEISDADWDLSSPMVFEEEPGFTGHVLFVNTAGFLTDSHKPLRGLIGREITPEQGYQAARMAALATLAAIHNVSGGTLNRCNGRCIDVPFPNIVPGFAGSLQVSKGAYDVFAGVFGDSFPAARAGEEITQEGEAAHTFTLYTIWDLDLEGLPVDHLINP